MIDREFLADVLPGLRWREYWMVDGSKIDMGSGVKATSAEACRVALEPVTIGAEKTGIIELIASFDPAFPSDLFIYGLQTPAWAKDPGATAIVSTTFLRRQVQWNKREKRLSIELLPVDLDGLLQKGIELFLAWFWNRSVKAHGDANPFNTSIGELSRDYFEVLP